jgi:hypothetical protein
MGFYWGSVAACFWLAAKSLRAAGLSWFLCFLMSCVHASTSPTHNTWLLVPHGQELFFPTLKTKNHAKPLCILHRSFPCFPNVSILHFHPCSTRLASRVPFSSQTPLHYVFGVHSTELGIVLRFAQAGF